MHVEREKEKDKEKEIVNEKQENLPGKTDSIS